MQQGQNYFARGSIDFRFQILDFRFQILDFRFEAVTSHGPINPKRKTELENLFRSSTVPLVMVTAFLSRKAMAEYLSDISWETDVWVAEDATHLVHFNGEHLLQAYCKNENICES